MKKTKIDKIPLLYFEKNLFSSVVDWFGIENINLKEYSDLAIL